MVINPIVGLYTQYRDSLLNVGWPSPIIFGNTHIFYSDSIFWDPVGSGLWGGLAASLRPDGWISSCWAPMFRQVRDLLPKGLKGYILVYFGEKPWKIPSKNCVDMEGIALLTFKLGNWLLDLLHFSWISGLSHDDAPIACLEPQCLGSCFF